MDLVDDEQALVKVTREEMLQLLACIRETWEALEDWEFQTRVGWTVEEILALRDKLEIVSESLPPRS